MDIEISRDGMVGIIEINRPPSNFFDYALIENIVRTANGRLTAAEALGHREFSMTKLYRSA